MSNNLISAYLDGLPKRPVSANSMPVTSVRIRFATPDDCQTVYQFVCDLEETSLDPVRFADVFARNLQNSSVWYLLAEQDGQAVGFASCHAQYVLHHAGRVGEIQELYVAPAHRGQQIGRQLVAALDALAVREGFINLEVTTNQQRTDALRFYERESFQRTHYKLVKSLLP